MTDDRRTDAEDAPLHGPHRLRVLDPEAARLSNLHDVRADRTWFSINPGASYRYRDATPRELAAYGFPPGTVVVVRVYRGELFYFFGAHLPGVDPRQTGARGGNEPPARQAVPGRRARGPKR